jgi:hypothetical protein
LKAKSQTKSSESSSSDSQGSESSDSDKDSSSSDEEGNTLVQLGDASDEWFLASQSGHGGLNGNTYERVIPERFSGGDGDSFMNSMIMNYAQEGKNADGTPNGNFQMTEAQTKQAAIEVLGTHKKMAGAELDAYLKQYFDRTFAHFDVNKAGMIDVGSIPSFMRFLASDQQMSM